MNTTQTATSQPVPAGSAITTNTVLFDTNVWLDYFLGSSGVADLIVDLIERLKVVGDSIATTVSIKKDVFYILPRELKRRASKVDSWDTPAVANDLYRQISWAVLEEIDNLATIVPIGIREDFFARHLKCEHGDYEDAALVATARSIGAKCVVTSDRLLLKRFPGECLSPSQALEKWSCP